MDTATLPSGVVTFVITDIEGSTKRFRRLGDDAYRAVLDAHHALLREQWRAHRGAEVKTVGDEFIVAFASAADAMVASVAAQRAIAEHPWPTDALLRIRIGVHTGLAYPRDGDYVALALHQAERVVGTANGGQVIASEDAVKAADVGAAVRFESLGAFRVRDFEQPVRLAAVLGEVDALDPQVAVRAVPAAGHNLIPVLSSFIGREADVERVAQEVRPGRVLTIVGPGGMGKTRLALEVAFRLAPEWPDGVWFVDLSTVSNERQVLSAVTDALGIPPGSGDEHGDLVAHLAGRRALLVVDNCEHVLVTVARLVDDVLARCPGVGVVATSRIPLVLREEGVWRLAPLPITEASVELFVDRARDRCPEFVPTATERDIVMEVCRRLDGMPLAIELAAARIAVLSPAEILAGLDRRFALLRSRDATASPRQRSMQALLDWGQAILTPSEQAVFRRLSVFRSSYDLDAASASAGFDPIDADDVAEIVWSLTDQSLLVADRIEGHTRYRMLETVRAYAGDRLREAEEEAVVRGRLAEHYLAQFPWQQVASKTTLDALELEADTLAPLVDGLMDDERSDDALALARLLSVFRTVQGRLTLALDVLERTIGRAPSTSGMLARAQLGAVLVSTRLGQIERAESHLREARRTIDECGAGDRWGRVSLARAEADIALRSGDVSALALAVDHLRAELEQVATGMDRADILSNLGEALGELGDPECVAALAECVGISRQLGDHGGLCAALASLAEHELRRGDVADAAAHQLECLRLAAELATPVAIANSFILAARIAEPMGSGEAALTLHALADVMLAEAGFALMP